MGGWTVDTVRRFLQRQLDDHRMLADERQLNTEKRFELVNEFRQALLDQTKNYVTRSEWEAGHARVVERLEELSERLNQAEGRGAGLHAGWLYLLGFITALGTVVSLAHIILT